MNNTYQLGVAAATGNMEKVAADRTAALRGRLVLTGSGKLVMLLPNALGHGAFATLSEPNIAMPVEEGGKYNAHVVVMTAREVRKVGESNVLPYVGKTFSFNIGPARTAQSNRPDEARIWFIEIRSPELKSLRKAFGLNTELHPFRMIFAVKRRVKRAAMTTEEVQSSLPHIVIAPSDIHGRGVFVTRDFKPGQMLVEDFFIRGNDILGHTHWIQTDECRFSNHSSDPNAKVIMYPDGSKCCLIATKDIAAGDEVLISYSDTTQTLSPMSVMSYQGKPYGNFKDVQEVLELLYELDPSVFEGTKYRGESEKPDGEKRKDESEEDDD